MATRRTQRQSLTVNLETESRLNKQAAFFSSISRSQCKYRETNRRKPLVFETNKRNQIMSPRKHQPKENPIKAESSPWTEPFQRAAEQTAAHAAPKAAETSRTSSAPATQDNPTHEALSAIFGS
jgi:hypothetical protein